jgi:hypothetical protein
MRTDLKPDTPKVPSALTRLPLLDLQRVTAGKPSLFASTTKRLALKGKAGTRTASIATPVAGITGVTVRASGTTRKGCKYTRIVRFDLRT